jgi:hypothetical protein
VLINLLLAVASLTAPPIEVSGSLLPSSGPKAAAELRIRVKNISSREVVLAGPFVFPDAITVKSYNEKGRPELFTSYAQGQRADDYPYPVPLPPGQVITTSISWKTDSIQRFLKGRYTVIFCYRPKDYASYPKKWKVLPGTVYSKPLKILIGERDVRIL